MRGGKERRMNYTQEVLTMAATTGIFTTLLNQGVSWLREWWTNKSRKKSEAIYLALRLAALLEEFVVKCVYRAWHDDADLTEGAIELDYNLPTLACYPQDSDWKSLDPELAGQILSFPNEITSARMACEFQEMREGNNIASAHEIIIAGVKAWRLAQDLRKKYDLIAITIKHIDFLEVEHTKIQQQQKEYAERVKFGTS
jgi:hypothetical protein